VALPACVWYWALSHDLCVEQLPSTVSVGAVDIHSVPVQLTTGPHTRSCAVVGAVVWYVNPSVHVLAAAVHAATDPVLAW